MAVDHEPGDSLIGNRLLSSSSDDDCAVTSACDQVHSSVNSSALSDFRELGLNLVTKAATDSLPVRETACRYVRV